MFSNNWKAFAEMIEGCEYASANRTLEQGEAFRLFHAFLLFAKENEGTIYFAEDRQESPLAAHFADEFLLKIKTPLCSLVSDYKDLTLSLATLIKKTDLLIVICNADSSLMTLEASAIAKEFEIPLITLSGGNSEGSLQPQGDLNFYFNSKNEGLIAAGQYSLINTLIKSWPYEPLPYPELSISEIIPFKLQPHLTQMSL